MDKDLKYYLALARTGALTPLRFRRLIEQLGSAERVFNAGKSELKSAGLPEEVAVKIIAARTSVDPEAELTRLQHAGLTAIPFTAPEYPPLLREIHDPPPVLYLRGKINWELPTIAMVGTRVPSPYGARAAEDFSSALARAGVAVISGLALGVDAIVHTAAVKAGGSTVAVLGSGVDRVAPTTNARLAERIVESGRGAIASEYPPGTAPRPEHFPARNRIISGLSLGTVVIEGSGKSGALITARAALDQNREVLALPGNIYSPMSAGPNALIKLGAHPVETPQDVLEILGLQNVASAPSAAVTTDPQEAKVLSRLSTEPKHIDAIARDSGLDIAAVTAMLAIMEIQGRVRHLGAMNYVRAA